MAKPKFLDNEAFRALRAGEMNCFNQLAERAGSLDFSDCDLRGADLRGADLSRVVIRGAYLRDADLRGIDLRALDLEGCSFYHAKISGCYFPSDITPEEIRLSLETGTRIRCQKA